MYIDPFWCGVAATIVVETAAVIAATVITGRKSKKK